eukprot:COSAG01_NODE_1317_length_10750_cov_1.790536_7_plen_119_part_00
MRTETPGQVGAKTQLWNVFCCLVIVVVLLVLVPLMRTLPNAALAAIIFIAFKSIVKQLSEVVSARCTTAAAASFTNPARIGTRARGESSFSVLCVLVAELTPRLLEREIDYREIDYLS